MTTSHTVLGERKPDPLLERITVEPGKCGGRACIRGYRIRVLDVLSWLAAGMTHEEILEDFPDLEQQDIYAALTYAVEVLENPNNVP